MIFSGFKIGFVKSFGKQKVFCIGMSKTGTTSMGTLFEDLKYRVCRGNWNNNVTNFLCSCYHYGDVDEIINITKYFDAFEDAPWGGSEIHSEKSDSGSYR